jgi:hypothetical protein
VQLAVFAHPFLVKRIRKGGAGALQTYRAAASAWSAAATSEGKQDEGCEQKDSSDSPGFPERGHEFSPIV